MQHHFVVVYDDERNTWEHDAEQTSFAFQEGEIWNETEGEFLAAYHRATPAEVTATNERASGDLAAMLALGQYARNMAKP